MPTITLLDLHEKTYQFDADPTFPTRIQLISFLIVQGYTEEGLEFMDQRSTVLRDDDVCIANTTLHILQIRSINDIFRHHLAEEKMNVDYFVQIDDYMLMPKSLFNGKY